MKRKLFEMTDDGYVIDSYLEVFIFCAAITALFCLITYAQGGWG